MRHRNKGRKLGRTRSHRKATLSNLATALIVHKRIRTTEAKAKELRPFVEKLITRAKRARVREDNNQLTGGNQTVDIHARRVVYKFIRDKAALEELFDTVADVIIDKGEERKGGYTRITKLGTRRGDASPMAVIELVDWGEERDGATTLNRRKKTRRPAASGASEAQSAQVEEVQAALEESLASAMGSMAEESADESEAASDEAPSAEAGGDAAADEQADDEESKS